MWQQLVTRMLSDGTCCLKENLHRHVVKTVLEHNAPSGSQDLRCKTKRILRTQTTGRSLYMQPGCSVVDHNILFSELVKVVD